jgi:predicted transglutaminase-like cysteine proteinase
MKTRQTRRQAIGGIGITLFATMLPLRPTLASENPAQPSSSIPGLFGSSEKLVGRPQRYLPKSVVLDQALSSDTDFLVGNARSSEHARWARILRDLSTRSPEGQIAGVDSFVNGFAWIDDDKLYGRDHWATPVEFLAGGGGDCEDFAIAKYAALAKLGFTEQRLRIAFAHDRGRDLVHALTIVYWGGDALVLDPLTDRPFSHAATTRYRPICSFNRQQLWMHKRA